MIVLSAAPYLSLLKEEHNKLKIYGLESLNTIVNELWTEIANNINEIENLYEEQGFEKKSLASLILSKIYYNLGDIEESIKYAVSSGEEFNIEERSLYVMTTVSRCINFYVSLSQEKFENKSIVIDDGLKNIFEKMVQKCCDYNEIKLALSISLEAYRYDIVEKILKKENLNKKEETLKYVDYLVKCCNSYIDNKTFKAKILNILVVFLLNLERDDSFFIISKIIMQLEDLNLATNFFFKLLNEKKHLIGLQVAFDFVSFTSKRVLNQLSDKLKKHSSYNSDTFLKKVVNILQGMITCELENTFLIKNNKTDILFLNQTKSFLEGRSSIFHSAITFANSFMHAGTSDDSFLRKNLEWLGQATSWVKFSATAGLGVIHKGNLFQGKKVLKPYFPESSSSIHTKSGSLFALGLIFLDHGDQIIEYLKLILVEFGNLAGNQENDVFLHGACLGAGIAAMASHDEELNESLEIVLYSESTKAGEAAGIAIGLNMLKSGNVSIINDLYNYAQETRRRNIIFGMSIGVSLICYGQENMAVDTIKKFMDDENSVIRYGGVFIIAMAYAGTANKWAIKKLLHYAISDPSNDVRRASVMCLGFLLIRDYKTVPDVVKLLSHSYNPHVRYGAALALGIACAGRCYQPALNILKSLLTDFHDFVRQGAMIASALILIQQNEFSYPDIKDFHKKYSETIKNKHEDSLAKFGAALAEGIINAGGRNVTISLENEAIKTLNDKAIVGLALFVQYWYWFPTTHFLSMAFKTTCVIGVNENLKIPDFELDCFGNSDLFKYPSKIKDLKEKKPDKLITAVLSTTGRSKAKSKKLNVKKQSLQKLENDNKMDIDNKNSSNTDVSSKIESTNSNLFTEEIDVKNISCQSLKTFKIPNLSRVVSLQANSIFSKNERFVPVRTFNSGSNIIVLDDLRPTDPIKYIKTVKQENETDAPIPEPFLYLDDD